MLQNNVPLEDCGERHETLTLQYIFILAYSYIINLHLMLQLIHTLSHQQKFIYSLFLFWFHCQLLIFCRFLFIPFS